MRLNHTRLGVTDIERAVEFYDRLGLIQIVAAYPRYARFKAPDGDAMLRDPEGNRIHLYRASENRLNPPWRL